MICSNDYSCENWSGWCENAQPDDWIGWRSRLLLQIRLDSLQQYKLLQLGPVGYYVTMQSLIKLTVRCLLHLVLLNCTLLWFVPIRQQYMVFALGSETHFLKCFPPIGLSSFHLILIKLFVVKNRRIKPPRSSSWLYDCGAGGRRKSGSPWRLVRLKISTTLTENWCVVKLSLVAGYAILTTILHLLN